MPRSTPAAKTKDKQRRVGRAPAITPEMRDALCELLQLGVSIGDACGAAGLSESTYYRYRAEGEEVAERLRVAEEAGRAKPKLTARDTRYLEFWQATTRARARKNVAYARMIREAGEGGVAYTEIRRELEAVRDPETGEVEHRLVKETQTRTVLRPDWRAAAWMLERTDPAHFGRRDALELSGDALTPEQAVNVGEAAVEDPVVGDAIDRMLDQAVGHHDELDDGPGSA
jgi:hypothetical protein